MRNRVEIDLYDAERGECVTVEDVEFLETDALSNVFLIQSEGKERTESFSTERFSLRSVHKKGGR